MIRRMLMVFSLIGVAAGRPSAKENVHEPNANGQWTIALHGGAGRISRDMAREKRDELEDSLRRALAVGKDILAKGGAALDAVEAVVAAMEDDPRFNAGKGAVFTRKGTHELDASIMDGPTLRCGAVAGITHQKNPIKVARLVMERSPHVLLMGEGADAFAAECGLPRIGQDYFYTARRFRELQEQLTKEGIRPPEKPAYDVPVDAKGAAGAPSEGTVGCVAIDVHGNLAAATSTGGVTGKRAGRVGDSPIPGAGTFANKTCAVSCTGKGEEFIRHSVAAKIAWLMEDRRLSLDQAVTHCLEGILQPGDGGIVAVDRHGHVSMRTSTGAMPRGIADSAGRFDVAIWPDP